MGFKFKAENYREKKKLGSLVYPIIPLGGVQFLLAQTKSVRVISNGRNLNNTIKVRENSVFVITSEEVPAFIEILRVG